MGVPVNISPVFNGWQGFDNNGRPLNGGLINTYQAGTSTPQATYSEYSGTLLHSNPIQLDSSGRLPGLGELWLLSGAGYKLVLTDSLANILGTYDNIAGTPTLASINTWSGLTNTFTGTVVFQQSFSFGSNPGQRILGDFSNATIPNRVLFLTSTTNGATEVGAIPNGASTTSGFSVFADPTPANCKFGRLSVDAAGVSLESNAIGAGVVGPLRFFVGAGNEVARFSITTGQITIVNTGAMSVNRNNVNQAAVATGVFTQVQLNTKAFDQNTNFNTGTFRFTPTPAGKYLITCNAQFTALTGVARTATLLYKNGVVANSNNVYGTAGQASGATVAAVVDANGTDYFELFCWHNSGGPEVVSGLIQDTFMTAHRIG